MSDRPASAVLHHAAVALAAEGWQPKVLRLDGPDHLAQITLGPHLDVSPDAMRYLQAIRVRHTDRRPVADTPIATEVVGVLRR